MRRSPLRVLAAALAAGLVASACGGRPPVVESGPAPGPQAVEGVLPDPIPASPAYLVRPKAPLPPGALARVERAPGVAVVAPVRREELRISGPDGSLRLDVGAVDALAFRSVAPEPTRDADFVWTSLLEGYAVVTFEAAKRLGIGEGARIRVPGYGALAVGAIADNGTPNVADVLVDLSVGQAAGIDASEIVVVGARSGTVLERLGERLERALPGARLSRLPTGPAAATPEPALGVATGGVIGSMRFRILKGGYIDPDPAWVAANIATTEVPILGSVTCHRLMFPQLRAAFAEIARAGLASEIRLRDFGGCFVPRFIDRDKDKPLSMHAFGLAIDLNTTTNALGTAGDLDPRVVAILEAWGFAWGGRWARPDPMHFELARLIQT